MLSNTCKYGIRALLYLAANAEKDKAIGIKKISQDLGIPTPFLGKILQSLARHKILFSSKGPHGGFGLNRPADRITLLDIIQIIDGNDVLDQCLICLKTCKEVDEESRLCPIHERYNDIRRQIYQLFNEQTVGSVIREMQNKSGVSI